jgi:hypothetical protein
LSEDDVRRQLEFLKAGDIYKNDPLIYKVIRLRQHIDVNVRAAPPGVGKTRGLMKDWIDETDSRHFFSSYSHKLLDEQERHLKKAGVSYRHLHGLQSCCPCCLQSSGGFFTEDGNFIEIEEEDYFQPLINALATAGVPVKQICEICKQKGYYSQDKCPYHLQKKHIKKVQIVIAPIEFTALGILDEYEPHYTTIDDCLLRYQLHPAKSFLELMLVKAQEQFYGEKRKQHDIVKTLPRLYSLSKDDYLKKMEIVQSVRRDLIASVKSMMTELPQEESFRLFFVSPRDFELYRKLSIRHGYRDQFATPYPFYCFDYINNNKDNRYEPSLKIMEAYIQPDCLNILKNRYFQDENIDIHFYDDGFKWELKNYGSTINEWLGRKGSWYPAQESVVKTKSTQEKFQNLIAWRTSLYTYLKSIGVIRPMKCELKDLLPKDFNINTLSLYFGNNRGNNLLEKCDMGFVAGSWNVPPESVIKDYQLLTASDPSTVEIIDPNPHGDWHHFKHKGLEAVRFYKEDYEQAQATMRFRPGLHRVEINVMGRVPNLIEEWGFKVNHCKLNRRGDGMKESREEWLIEYVKANNNHVPEKMARDEMADHFTIRLDTAYREIRKIVRYNDHLRLEWTGTWQLEYAK